MHTHLTYIIAQQGTAEMRAAAERSGRPAADQLRLADGRRLKIRPIERQDRDRLKRLFMRLSPESRYRRYLSPKPALSERELDHLLDVDHVRHEALAAVDESDGSFVAAARYVQRPDQPRTAEVAIEVADDAQRQGIGTELAIQTLQRARANGFTHATASTLHENTPALALLRALHFRRGARDRHEIEFGLELHPELATLSVTSCRGDKECSPRGDARATQARVRDRGRPERRGAATGHPRRNHRYPEREWAVAAQTTEEVKTLRAANAAV